MQNFSQIRIFLSSPGDVEERDLAEQVVKEIGKDSEFRDHFSLRLYRWDDKEVVLPMEATETPQKSVDTYMTKPSDCDLVVVMFWSRMGTPLIMDEREYLSGTHYEYKDAIEARQKQGKPSVWLYRCTRKPTLDMTDPDAFKKLEQYRLVDEFFKGFEDETGRFKGGINFYEAGDEFADTFGKQLSVFLRKLKDNPPPTQPPKPETKPHYEGKPYPGLEALTDERIFFGREREKLDVLALLDQQRIVFLIGASGSGKSSLAAAGVVPRLQRRQGWQVVRFTPGNDPFLNLAKCLVKDLAEIEIAPLDRLQEAQDLADQLRQGKTSLADLLDMLTDDKILLFADQFEELFTLTPEADQAAFADLLKHDAAQVRVLATMRADFYENAAPHFEKHLRQNFTLSQPSPFALYAMVTQPASLAGLRFDAGLPEQIVTDLGDEPGALALMAYLLEQLYVREQGRGDGVLRQADYNDLGGVQKAIGTHAETIYQQIPADDEAKDAWMQRVFHELVSVDERGTATRRRVPLAQIADDDMPYVDAFAAQTARLLVKGQDTLEVAHEALFRSWERLRDWVSEAQEDLILLRQVRNAAQEWQEKGRPDFLLWPQERLTLVYAMQDRLHPELSEVERDFIEPEAKRLLRELETLPRDATSHERRRDIGDRLAVIGDPRPGLGVVDRMPDMVWLPVEGGGEITIEYGGSPFGGGDKEKETATFKISPFLIAQYQVTYAQFQVFVEAEDGFENDAWWDGMPKDYQKQSLSNQRTKIANAPRDSVSWYQSVAFARWMNHRFNGLEIEHPGGVLRVGDNAEIRLPTEWEWQWAAMNGSETREYPWQGGWQEGYANTSEAGLNRTTAVGMYPHGIAECGALDMAGNLYELCLNKYNTPEDLMVDDSGDRRVRRGGSFYGRRDFAAVASRSYRYPAYDYNSGGFRLVLCLRPM